MKEIVKNVFLFALLFCGVSCTQMTELESYLSNTRTTISISQALQSMEKLIDSNAIPTRAGDASQYAISVVGGKDFSKETKSIGDKDIPDTLLYIVNFGNEEGFSILSGDSRIKTPVFCLTEKGSISLEDFVDAYRFLHDTNQEEVYDMESVFVPSLILASALSGLRDDGGEEHDDDEDHDDWGLWLTSMLEIWGGGPNGGYIKKGPYVKTKWGQSIYPLNSLLNNEPAGCMAIAVGQIIVANKYTNTLVFDGVTCNLDTLETVRHYSHPDSPSTPYSANACNQAAHFINFLRSPDLLNMTGPNADADDAVNAFEYLGYDDVEKIHNEFSFTSSMSARVINMLDNYYPVVVGGSRWGAGHAWVVDGYLFSQRLLFFHINWGWNGEYDGYYDYGVFDSGQTHFADSIIDIDNSSNNPTHHYFYNFAMIEYSY